MGARFEIRSDKSGQPYFVLISSNGKVLVKSESYASKAMCQRGYTAVRRYAPKATVVDVTARATRTNAKSKKRSR